MIGAYLLQLPGRTAYGEAFALQRSLAAAVSEGAIPDTVILLEHEPVVTLGRRTDEAAELHLPEGVDVEVVETNRGGKSTYHGPGQLVCYPILDLNRHGRDLRKYVRDLEQAIIVTLASLGIRGRRIEGLTGVWVAGRHGGQSPGADPIGTDLMETNPMGTEARKIASIGVHASRWVTTHGYALNVDLDLAPFTQWITACGLEDARFTSMANELGRPVAVDDVMPAAAEAFAEAFGLELAAFPAARRADLWPRPVDEPLAAR